MKNKIISIATGLIIGCLFTTTIFATDLLSTAKIENVDVIFLGEKLNLAPNTIISTGSNDLSNNYETYVNSKEILDRMGYYSYLDTFNQDFVVSRYLEEIDDLKLESTLAYNYNGKLLKKSTKAYLDANIKDSIWEYRNEGYYMKYIFSANGKYEFIHKKSKESDYDKETGTYVTSNGGIHFKSEENRRYDKFDEVKNFGNTTTAGDIEVRIEENNTKALFFNFNQYRAFIKIK